MVDSRVFGEELVFVIVVSKNRSGSSMSTSSIEGKVMSVTDIVVGIGELVNGVKVSSHARFVKSWANEFCWVTYG